MKHTTLVAAFAVSLSCFGTAEAALIHKWDAGTLAAGAVATWTSSGALSVTAAGSSQPTNVLAATPNGTNAVLFDGSDDALTSTSGPLAGLSVWSLAYVFKADAVGQGGASFWYDNTGIVDAEEPNVVNDFGTAINNSGQVGFGVGNPDNTLYSANSMVDGDWHVAVFTSGAAGMALYMDGAAVVSNTATFTDPRNDAGVAFGRLLTDVNGYFSGSLAEVRFYDSALDATEAGTLIQELTQTHITGVPVPGVLALFAIGLPGLIRLARRA